MSSRRRAVAVRGRVLGVLAALAACGGAEGDPVDAGPADASASCLEAAQHSDFAFVETEIFGRGCNRGRACHRDAATEAAGLNLETGRAYDALIERASKEQPTYRLVVPGDPDASYLMIALGAVAGPLPSEGRMPLNAPALCSEKVDALKRWIAAGAARF